MTRNIKFFLDIFLAFFLFLILSPLLAAVAVSLFILKGKALEREPKLGRDLKTFSKYSFYISSTSLLKSFRSLPVLLNILKGDMSFVGPRPMSGEECDLEDSDIRKRHTIKPGLICLWWIRQRANIAYGNELEVDLEYIENQSMRGDIGIMLRAAPAFFYGKTDSIILKRLKISGVPINNLSMSEALLDINDRLNLDTPSHICFINAHCVNIAHKDMAYFNILQKSDTNLADGIGVKLAGKILKRNIRENVNGTDMFPLICKELSGSGKGLFLLGGKPGIVDKVQEWIEKNYPDTRIAGYHHGYFSLEEEKEIINKIYSSGADLLLVAMGVPRQEKWIDRNLQKTGVKVSIGVGGLFDFYSGNIPRAPVWMREIGMEWLFRFSQEPARMWRRYFAGNFIFMMRVIKEKFQSKKN